MFSILLESIQHIFNRKFNLIKFFISLDEFTERIPLNNLLFKFDN